VRQVAPKTRGENPSRVHQVASAETLGSIEPLIPVLENGKSHI
jgi:hypothetical protein